MPVEENADMATAHRQICEAESKLEELKKRQRAWYEGGESKVMADFDGEGGRKTCYS